MQPMINVAVRAARSAGNIIVHHINRLDRINVEAKGENDFVSDVDRMAEDEIRASLKQAYPDHAVVGEERGGAEDADYVWVVDPLDGTLNYLRGVPHFAVSIALKHRGALEAGVIYDPVRQELWTAKRGGGCTFEGRRMRIQPRPSIDNALLGTGFPLRLHAYHDAYLGMFGDVFRRAGDLRRGGSAALDLAYVACGRLDGFWEIGLKPWDMAAGALMIREAGGIVGDFAGGDGYLDTGNIIAGSPKLFADLVRTIAPHRIEGIRA
ncbi:inositol monophosphatase family protein [Spiribacter roseus]|jgi:myo-inositol-1(or 4)-monophosphatase|uniref:Inositol-1-monophosphatase n=1 Tax=Spiribacter roseus TaxID=1855875 RepID=A0ABV3RZ35_9GAMM|nr:inositol monophosphatase family protein [Spiribacter roseus]KAF0281351.1 inositol monophosphatase [Spiribacter roseus]KAF0283648.1 inositol monophosphatase [Spiribacter roseus]PYZ99855.1 inositol monophosphatase [Gammaproteobacteria bacterium 2W06]